MNPLPDFLPGVYAAAGSESYGTRLVEGQVKSYSFLKAIWARLKLTLRGGNHTEENQKLLDPFLDHLGQKYGQDRREIESFKWSSKVYKKALQASVGPAGRRFAKIECAFVKRLAPESNPQVVTLLANYRKVSQFRRPDCFDQIVGQVPRLSNLWDSLDSGCKEKVVDKAIEFLGQDINSFKELDLKESGPSALLKATIFTKNDEEISRLRNENYLAQVVSSNPDLDQVWSTLEGEDQKKEVVAKVIEFLRQNISSSQVLDFSELIPSALLRETIFAKNNGAILRLRDMDYLAEVVFGEDNFDLVQVWNTLEGVSQRWEVVAKAIEFLRQNISTSEELDFSKRVPIALRVAILTQKVEGARSDSENSLATCAEFIYQDLDKIQKEYASNPSPDLSKFQSEIELYEKAWEKAKENVESGKVAPIQGEGNEHYAHLRLQVGSQIPRNELLRPTSPKSRIFKVSSKGGSSQASESKRSEETVTIVKQRESACGWMAIDLLTHGNDFQQPRLDPFDAQLGGRVKAQEHLQAILAPLGLQAEANVDEMLDFDKVQVILGKEAKEEEYKSFQINKEEQVENLRYTLGRFSTDKLIVLTPEPKHYVSFQKIQGEWFLFDPRYFPAVLPSDPVDFCSSKLAYDKNKTGGIYLLVNKKL